MRLAQDVVHFGLCGVDRDLACGYGILGFLVYSSNMADIKAMSV